MVKLPRARHVKCSGHVTATWVLTCSCPTVCFDSLLPMDAQSKQAPPKQLTPLGYALAGALGGCFSNAYVQPLTIGVALNFFIHSVVYPLDT
jgi:hypothetical protein